MSAAQGDIVAELQRANMALTQERDAARAREVALAEVLDVINRSPSDPQPVFDKIVDAALTLCGASFGGIVLYDGALINRVSLRGGPGNDRLLEIARQIGPDQISDRTQRMRQDRRRGRRSCSSRWSIRRRRSMC